PFRPSKVRWCSWSSWNHGAHTAKTWHQSWAACTPSMGKETWYSSLSPVLGMEQPQTMRLRSLHRGEKGMDTGGPVGSMFTILQERYSASTALIRPRHST